MLESWTGGARQQTLSLSCSTAFTSTCSGGSGYGTATKTTIHESGDKLSESLFYGHLKVFPVSAMVFHRQERSTGSTNTLHQTSTNSEALRNYGRSSTMIASADPGNGFCFPKNSGRVATTSVQVHRQPSLSAVTYCMTSAQLRHSLSPRRWVVAEASAVRRTQ